jgi:hypothetical protein
VLCLVLVGWNGLAWRVEWHGTAVHLNRFDRECSMKPHPFPPDHPARYPLCGPSHARRTPHPIHTTKPSPDRPLLPPFPLPTLPHTHTQILLNPSTHIHNTPNSTNTTNQKQPNPRFPWLQKLEENAAIVQQELKEAMQMGEMLEQTGNNVWIGALTAEGAAYGPDWKVCVGVWVLDVW